MAAHGSTCVTCACDTCRKIRSTIGQIFRALEIHGWMLDSYVVDFFQDNLWQRLPSGWQTFLDEVTPEELGCWILKERRSKRVWPLSLLALRRFVETTEICRDHKAQSSLKCESRLSGTGNNLEERDVKNDEVQISTDKKQHNNLFTKHVKKKKRYEIDVISQIVVECTQEADCDCIVDVGSGMGHLARVLSYRHDLSVTCIEQNHLLLDEARKLDEQLGASLAKCEPGLPGRRPRHVSLVVGASRAARRQLADQLSATFAERRPGFGLVGLHPCGDLAATLLRFYATEPTARFICIVGCCYMKMSRDPGAPNVAEEHEIERGYPMSRHMTKTNEHRRLSYAALEVACHAVEKHCDKLKENKFSDLIVHSYRAVLEYLLIEKKPSLRHTQLKNSKIKEETTFKEYCDNATECLEPKDRPTDSDYAREDVKNFLLQWKRVLAFGSLRLLLAPLVETLVLYDRFLYLSELGLAPSLKAEFDSRISPRNILLVSIKKKRKTEGV